MDASSSAPVSEFKLPSGLCPICSIPINEHPDGREGPCTLPGVRGLNLPSEACVPPEINEAIKTRWHCATMSIERRDALESLWVAIKELNADGTGYTPKLAEAVARLRKLEVGDSL